MNSLLEHGIQTELNGGDVPAVPISALKVLKKLIDLIKKSNIIIKNLFNLHCKVKHSTSESTNS